MYLYITLQNPGSRGRLNGFKIFTGFDTFVMEQKMQEKPSSSLTFTICRLSLRKSIVALLISIRKSELTLRLSIECRANPGPASDLQLIFLGSSLSQHITVEQIAEEKPLKRKWGSLLALFLTKSAFHRVKVWVTHTLCVNHTYNIRTSVLYETEPLQSCRMFRMWLWHPGFLRACF